jgi:hypothetical protein
VKSTNLIYYDCLLQLFITIIYYNCLLQLFITIIYFIYYLLLNSNTQLFITFIYFTVQIGKTTTLIAQSQEVHSQGLLLTKLITQKVILPTM